MPNKQPIQPPQDPMFYTWDKDDAKGQAIALQAAGAALQQIQPVVRTKGVSYLNVAPGNVSVRDQFTRQNYESFRPSEAIPKLPKDIIRDCMEVYETNGLISNIIDTMSDFVVQGIDIVHPNQRIEQFFKTWFYHVVKGPDRSERIASLLPRAGTAIVRRHTAKLKKRDEDNLRRGIAADQEATSDLPPVSNREIPWRYTVLAPLSLDVMGAEMMPLLGPDTYSFAVQLPDSVVKKMRYPQTEVDKNLVDRLPDEVYQAIKRGDKFIELDPQKTQALFYKKDDWKVWGKPMVAPILKDIKLLEKMKLADMAALDGAISNIRVWKLGNLENRIMPSASAMQRLAEMLCSNVGGGVMDLVWTADIDLLETSTDVHQFLGDTKYGPVLTAIYAGLGIPPTLTGSATQSGFTNNFISIKTLVQRLQYIRDRLIAFWDYEIRIVQKAMGFRFPAQIVFDRMVLTDESSELALLIQLFDRLGISLESLQERFGMLPDIEQVRIRREVSKRDSGYLPPKAGPFHDGQPDFTLEKIFVQTGALAPSQVGLELSPKKPGDQSPIQHDAKHSPQPAPGDSSSNVKGPMPGPGRPINSRDTQKRKQRTPKPRSKASVFMQNLAWSETAQNTISKFINPVFLKTVGKENMRQLTAEEARNVEAFKFAFLCQLGLHQTIDEDTVKAVIKKKMEIPAPVSQLLKTTISTHVEKNGVEPSTEHVRMYQAGAYALWRGDYHVDKV